VAPRGCAWLILIHLLVEHPQTVLLMGAKKPRMAANVRRINAVLMDDWDPIGIRGGSEAANEYDSYALPIYLILRQNRSEAALVDYLKWMLQRMELSASQDTLRSVAIKLLQIDVSGDEEFQ
jgi:hypothetical protein